MKRNLIISFLTIISAASSFGFMGGKSAKFPFPAGPILAKGNQIWVGEKLHSTVYLFKDKDHISGVAIYYPEFKVEKWIFPKEGLATPYREQPLESLKQSWDKKGPSYSEKLHQAVDTAWFSKDGHQILLISGQGKYTQSYDVQKGTLKRIKRAAEDKFGEKLF